MDSKRGFIKIIILAIISLALVKYFFNWSLFEAIDSERGQATVDYIHKLVDAIWAYISTPVIFIWTRIIWPILSLLWETFLAFLSWSEANISTPAE